MMRQTAGRAILLASIALAACNGWPPAPELEAVRDKPEKYATYAPASAEHAVIEFDGRRWVVSPAATTLTGARLRQVGSTGQTAFFSVPGDEPPYDVLYAPDGARWRRVLPID